MLPIKTIEDLIKKHSLLEKELSSGEIDKKLFAEKSKEYSEVKIKLGTLLDYFKTGPYHLVTKNTRIFDNI